MKRILISGIFIGLFITIGTTVAILYANGVRISFNKSENGKFIEGTGLLVTTSKPDGARVLINNHLTTATNNTINLNPGQYDVQIEKDGYRTWQKKIEIKKGLVSEANALLFPTAPKFEAITTIGISNVVMDSTGNSLAYTVSSSSATKNGIYILNINSRPLIFLGASGTQIVNDVLDRFSQAKISFSPDSKEILGELPNAYYLLSTSGRNDAPQDVTNTLSLVQREWEEQKQELDSKVLESFPRDLRRVAQEFFKDFTPSPEGDKILYTASESASLPLVLKKKVPSLNSTTEQRTLSEGSIYVYDIKEDKNYELFIAWVFKQKEKMPQFFWLSSSRHLIYARDGKINVVEYDGENQTTVYEGFFIDNLIFPWPDGSSIAIISRLSPSVPYNLYSISLR